MGTALPSALRVAIEAFGAGVSGREMAHRASAQSTRYRSAGDSTTLETREDAAAYVAVRMPATFAAVAAVLAELTRIRPQFAPLTLLDVACGSGSATFAALTHFPSIEHVHLIDRNPTLLAAAATLADASGMASHRRLSAETAMASVANLPAADLVTLSYALVEMPEAAIAPLAVRLYAAARQGVVLVEPGSQAGFRRIRLARDVLLSAGARIVAPCTHQGTCLMQSPDWCHFSVRLARSREHLRAKSARVPFEDERFSYLVALRDHPEAQGQAGRILSPPSLTKAGITLRCCEPAGVIDRHVAARDANFRALRRLSWGDVVELQQAQGRD
ncbi:MAG TPA: small ribosomal subunit Rsm22 family protein [Beijerinckiaceae bacterium]|nr:small ribosomal subunit Rsm22 family protein [Beijerinckiaceae bacterium]